MKSARLLLGIAIGGLGLVAVLQNAAMARLEFLWWALEGPMYLLLLVVFCSGLLAGYLFGRGTSRRKRKQEQAGTDA